MCSALIPKPASFRIRLPQSVVVRDRPLAVFFVLVFVSSIPFYLFGLTGLQLLPGLPVSALAFVCPLFAAFCVVFRKDRAAGVITLLKRSFDYKRIKSRLWYAPILFLTPGASALTYVLLQLSGQQLPVPRFSLLDALLLFVMFFIAAVCEELGWSAYALDPMQARWGALPAGVLLGVIWAVWHWVPLVEAHRSPAWIAWWSLGTVSSRVIMTWLYNKTGKSVFGAALFHDMSNLSWQLFPNNGSHWDPRINGLILLFITLIVSLSPGGQVKSSRVRFN